MSEENEPSGNVHSLAVHKLIGMAKKITHDRRQLRQLADSTDPGLWERMARQARENIQNHDNAKADLQRNFIKRTGDLTTLSVAFSALAIGIAIGQKTTAEQSSTLTTLFLGAAAVVIGGLGYIGYRWMKDSSAMDAARPAPEDIQTMNLVRQELLSRLNRQPDQNPPEV